MVVRIPQAGHADGVGAYAEGSLQVLRVHEKAGELIPVFIQTEEDADAHVIDPALHGPVHGCGVVVIVVLGACGVELKVAFLCGRSPGKGCRCRCRPP